VFLYISLHMSGRKKREFLTISLVSYTMSAVFVNHVSFLLSASHCCHRDS
jgi:hypothetical protein